MRTTLEIDADLLAQVVDATGASTKRRAIETALKEFLRSEHQRALCQLIGNYDDYGLSLDDLERMRDDH